MKTKLFFLIIILMAGAGKCLSQKYDTIQVGLSTTVNLIFESTILKKHLGSGTYLEGTEQVQDVLIESSGERMTLTARIEDFERTNLFVETESAFYNFILVHAAWPKQQLIGVELNKASMLKKKKADPEKEKSKLVDQQILKRRDTVAVLAQKVYDKSHIKNPDIGSIDQKMSFYVDGIYVDDKYILIRVTMSNEGNVKFDLGYEGFSFKEETTKATKKVAKAPAVPVPVVYTINEDVKVINKNEALTKVYVFEKFTVDKSRYFAIDLWEDETKGKRRVELHIPEKEILNAKTI